MGWRSAALVVLSATAAVHQAAGLCKIHESPGMSGPLPYAQPQPTVKYPDTSALPYNPCPMYTTGDDACCSPYQLQAMWVNFLLLDSKFGAEAGGGSPACAANLREAWCHQTCSPHQDQLLSDPHLANASIPGQPGVFEVLKYSLNMNKGWACSVYDSCSAVTTVVEGAFNCEGLWNYQGHAPSVQQSQHVYIDFNFIEATMPDAVEAPIQYCCGYENSAVLAPGPPPTGNSSSPCSSCTGSCPGQVCPVKVHTVPSKFTPAQLIKPLYAPLDGFLWTPVAWFYGTLLVATVLMAGLQHWQWSKRQAAAKEAQGSSPYTGPESSQPLL